MNSLVLKSFSRKILRLVTPDMLVWTGAFETQPKFVGYGEIDLHCCHHWYKDLQICIANWQSKRWWPHLVLSHLLSLTLLLPNRTWWKTNIFLALPSLRRLALKFDVSGFAPQATTTSSIRLALENEITIMIMTKKKAGPIDTWKSMWEEKIKEWRLLQRSLLVGPFLRRKERNDVAAFISWLLVAKHDALHLSQKNGWRQARVWIVLDDCNDQILLCGWYTWPRQLKSICNLLNHLHSISTPYLCFKQMNNHYDDGFGIPLRHVKYHLSANKSEESKISIFHVYAKEPKSVAYQLMHLRSGCLPHFQLAPMDETQSVLNRHDRHLAD